MFTSSSALGTILFLQLALIQLELMEDFAHKMILDIVKKLLFYFHILSNQLLSVRIHLIIRIYNCGQIMLKHNTRDLI